MKQSIITFLQIILILIGIVVLYGIIRFPQTEGVARNKDLISIYTDPFIIYGYIASIPFFVGLYQVFKLLGYIGGKTISLQNAVSALRTIRNCAIATFGFVIPAEILILLNHGDDDPAGAVAMGFFLCFISLIVAASALLFQKRLKK
jgi:hypothetical protein